MNVQSKERAFFLLLFLSTGHVAEAFNFPSRNFIARDLKHCTGFCDEPHINCTKGISKQGYYDWCRQHCTHKKKIRRESFLQALENCDRDDMTETDIR